MQNIQQIHAKAQALLDRKTHVDLCVRVNICPDCGEELRDFGDENHDIEMGCNKCGDAYQVNKYFFGPMVTKRRIKYWG